MDATKILVVLAKAEAQIVRLDEAIASCDNEEANWTFIILARILQDLGRLVREEPIPAGLDVPGLDEIIQTGLNAAGDGIESIHQGEYRLSHSDSITLVLALDDIRQIMNAMSDGSCANEEA